MFCKQTTYSFRPSDRVQKKMENYVEECDDYAEKAPDYAEISNINKVVPLAFSNV